MKKFYTLILSVLITFANLFAQGVDLPEFVIEGVQKVSLPKIKKSSAGFIKPLGDEYFKHKFSPEDFDVKVSGSPDTTVAVPFVRDISYSGRIKAAGGINTLPAGELFAKYSNDNFLLTISGNAKRVANYEPYSAIYKGGGKFDLEYYFNKTGNNKAFNIFGLNGAADYYDRNFWVSATPALKRKALLGNGEFVFSRFSPNKYKFTVLVGGEYAKSLKENFIEQNLNGAISAEYNFSPFKVLGKFSMISQTSKSRKQKQTNYYSGIIKARVKMSDNFHIDFGGVLAFAGSENFFYPVLGISYNVSKYFILKASVNAKTNFYTHFNMMKFNPYYNSRTFKNAFTREIDKIKFTAIFNYYNYFSASLSARYGAIDGFIYFDDSNNRGIFDVKTLDEVRTASINFNTDFLYSKFGYFSLKSVFSDVRLTNGNIAPYSPGIKIKAAYNFNYLQKFSLAFGTDYFSHYYADIRNGRRIEPGWNLWTSVKYNILSNFNLTLDVNNILNKNNYFLPGYKSVPFDLLLGAEYFWK